MAGGALQHYLVVLIIINGLHAAPGRDSLGVLSELLQKDSKSPLIVVVDSSKDARLLDENSIKDSLYQDDGSSYDVTRNDRNYKTNQNDRNKNRDDHHNQNYEINRKDRNVRHTHRNDRGYTTNRNDRNYEDNRNERNDRYANQNQNNRGYDDNTYDRNYDHDEKKYDQYENRNDRYDRYDNQYNHNENEYNRYENRYDRNEKNLLNDEKLQLFTNIYNKLLRINDNNDNDKGDINYDKELNALNILIEDLLRSGNKHTFNAAELEMCTTEKVEDCDGKEEKKQNIQNEPTTCKPKQKKPKEECTTTPSDAC